MRVVLLGRANSIHVIRWANGLVSRGVEVHIATCHPVGAELDRRVAVHVMPIKAPLGYLGAVGHLRKVLRRVKPGLMNVHYATGYGLLGRLSRFRPLLLSVWGADVYDFPTKSCVHRKFVQENLSAADAIGSTSHCMLRKVRELEEGVPAFITPFGIDEKQFCPLSEERSDQLVIGTVKSLSPKYGIDILIRAFAKACELSEADMRLEITGDGPDGPVLRKLVAELGISGRTVFHGAVPYSRVPAMLSRLDIYAALSRWDSESFGVAILEASACKKPVIVSDADGPAEVTVQGSTGLVVPKNNVEAAAKAIVALVEDPLKRRTFGEAGRAHVLKHYTWEKSLDSMLHAYRSLL